MENPILINVPELIETPRLLIKAMKEGMGEEVYMAAKESWQDLREWVPWAQGELPTKTEYEIFCREGYSNWIKRTNLWVGMWEKSSGIYVGGSGLHRPNWKVPSFEIGYWCRSSMTGKGYITETVKALTQMAFEKLNCRRLEIRCDSLNTKSRAVMQRCGFEHEATLKRDSLNCTGKELRDTLVYARFTLSNLEDLEISYGA